MPTRGQPVLPSLDPVETSVQRFLAAFGRKWVPLLGSSYFVCTCSLLVVLAWGGRLRLPHAVFFGARGLA